jgi:hypothetical protein
MTRVSKGKMSERVALTLTVRALAVSLAIFALVVTFAIVGGYQGIKANHDTTQAIKQSQVDGRLQRIAAQQAIIDAANQGFCDVVYYVDSNGLKSSPFLEHLRQVHKCAAASVHKKGAKAPSAPTKKPLPNVPGGSAVNPKVSNPPSHGGNSPAPSGSRRPSSTPSRSGPQGQTSPAPPPRPPNSSPPLINLPSILSYVCTILPTPLRPCV